MKHQRTSRLLGFVALLFQLLVLLLQFSVGQLYLGLLGLKLLLRGQELCGLLFQLGVGGPQSVLLRFQFRSQLLRFGQRFCSHGSGSGGRQGYSDHGSGLTQVLHRAFAQDLDRRQFDSTLDLAFQHQRGHIQVPSVGLTQPRSDLQVPLWQVRHVHLLALQHSLPQDPISGHEPHRMPLAMGERVAGQQAQALARLLPHVESSHLGTCVLAEFGDARARTLGRRRRGGRAG